MAKFWLCTRYEDMEPGICTLGDILFQLTSYSTYPDAVTLWLLGMDFKLYRLTFDSGFRHILSEFETPWSPMTDVSQLPRYLSIVPVTGFIFLPEIVPQVGKLAAYLLEAYGTTSVIPT